MIEGLKPYAEYKESGLALDYGQLPKHWSMTSGGKHFSPNRHLPVRAEDEIVTCFRDGQVTACARIAARSIRKLHGGAL